MGYLFLCLYHPYVHSFVNDLILNAHTTLVENELQRRRVGLVPSTFKSYLPTTLFLSFIVLDKNDCGDSSLH